MGNTGGFVYVLLTARPPMEESGILENSRIAVANFKCNPVTGEGLFSKDVESCTPNAGWGSNKTFVNNLLDIKKRKGFKSKWPIFGPSEKLSVKLG